MVDGILSKVLKPGMLARLKVGDGPKASLAPGMTAAENRLADIITISAEAKARAETARKVDAHLRFFSGALKIFNGFFNTGYKTVPSKVSIDYVPMKNPGINKKV